MPSLIVHSLLLFILLWSAYYAKKLNVKLVKNPYVWCAITLVAFIIGSRWNANDDWYNYYSTISDTVEGNFDLERFEIIPRYITIIIHKVGLPYHSWFICMAFLQLTFLMLAANNGLKKITIWLVFLYFYSLFSLSTIITRQVAALMVVLYAYTFINQRRIIIYLILIAIAYCFHRTSLVALPLYWIIPKIRLNSILLQLIVVSFFAILGDKLVQGLWSLVLMNEELRYIHYADAVFDYGANSGWGVRLNYIRYYTVILYSCRLKDMYDKSGFSIFYTIMLIDACLYNGLKNDLALSRIEMYLSVADLVASGFLLHYLLHSRNSMDKMLFAGLVGLMIVVIIYSAYKGMPWVFVWDSNVIL